MLQPKGKELKKLVERQRRIEFNRLVEWDGGTNFTWHPEGTHRLLHPHDVPISWKRRGNYLTGKHGNDYKAYWVYFTGYSRRK